MNGHFITLEGGEGAGKTSLLPILAESLEELGYEVLTTREPGGIEIAEQIREIILNPAHVTIDARTEALLYAAARRQHLVEKVLPALEDGKVVLCDRFIDSSLSYQGHARGLGIDDVLSINQFAVQSCMPTLTLFFDISPQEGLRRITNDKTREKNRLDLEEMKFHHLVYEGYQILIDRYPERIKLLNASQGIGQVKKDALDHIISYLGQAFE